MNIEEKYNEEKIKQKIEALNNKFGNIFTSF